MYLKWNALKDEQVALYTIERSNDGVHFTSVKNAEVTAGDSYNETDALQNFPGNVVYYRLAVKISGGGAKYSSTIVIDLKQPGTKNKVTVAPNPVVDNMQLQIYSSASQLATFEILDGKGSPVISSIWQLEKGNTTINLAGFENRPVGIYTLKVMMNNEVLLQRFLLSR